MRDPTRDEMLDFLNDKLEPLGGDEFDREEAIYWFAANYHGGQGSNLYSALSTSEYQPGPLRRGPEDGFFYNLLVQEYGK